MATRKRNDKLADLDNNELVAPMAMMTDLIATQAMILAVTSDDPERVAAGRKLIAGHLRDNLAHAAQMSGEIQASADKAIAQAPTAFKIAAHAVWAPVLDALASMRDCITLAQQLAGPEIDD